MAFCLINEPVEDVVDLLTDVSTETQKFSINPIERKAEMDS